MSRNVLDKKKSHALTVWLTEKAPQLRELKLHEVAETAALNLGFPVTKGNIISIRDAFDLDLGRHHAAVAPDHAQIIDDLRESIAALSEQLQTIKALLRSHLEDHGETDVANRVNGVCAMPAQLNL